MKRDGDDESPFHFAGKKDADKEQMPVRWKHVYFGSKRSASTLVKLDAKWLTKNVKLQRLTNRDRLNRHYSVSAAGADEPDGGMPLCPGSMRVD